MITKVFSIYDSCAGAFLPPFHLPRAEMAIRAFADCVNSKDHQFSEHPEDYTLFEIANFDDNTGEFKNIEPVNKKHASGLSLKKHPADEALEVLPFDKSQPEQRVNGK